MLRHAVLDHLAVGRAFPPQALARIEQAIAAGERTHRGQVCFAVEAALPPLRVLGDLAPRERALEVFGLLRVWDTEENAGVLIYLLLADRDVEIVADRGIDRRVDPAAWRDICARMESAFAERRFEAGVMQGIEEVSALLAAHFPSIAGTRNELPDKPVVL
ncbi:MAG TPA: TPM domain-containing protein [Casimicrobiaceae bacterium]|nr:TPM domain-containing protein [Casimicrobiaceae bacterium]